MSNDVRFAYLDLVAGGPNFRFYCIAPITTKNGINIGILAVRDSQPRERLTENEEHRLCETAAQVMTHLQLNREAIESRQARRIWYAPNGFVAGKSSLDDGEAHISGKQPSARSLFGIDEAVGVSYSPTQSQPSRRCETQKRCPTAQKRQRAQEKRNSAEENGQFCPACMIKDMHEVLYMRST